MKVVEERDHPKGRIIVIQTNEEECQILITHHALSRARHWKLSLEKLVEAILYPEEVLTGHHDRFIAHKAENDHIIRVIYEYENGVPIVVTVYRPRKERYFMGGGVYEDRVLARC
ncbi:DUF4258 domain-containing protein [Thermococcus sp. AM4]|uniref:DUF4258 domain-containing protein n=1 Tax=Thermococcus sp. (strain AM4) TaxID=246969 RepID=UPI00064F75C8|nr:DUF4258 domain-containing protein [Thermococcus sp. AM4]